MATIDAAELRQLLQTAGFSGDAIDEGVAIARCESSLRTDVVVREDNGSTSTGLFQINSVHGVSVSALKNPRRNVQEARRLYEAAGKRWDRDWVRCSKGLAARVAEDRSNRDTNLSDIPVIGDTAEGIAAVANAVGAAAGAVKGFFEYLTDPNTWRRIALVVAGGGIVLVGAATLARGTEFGKQVESAAVGVASKGTVSTKGKK